MKKALVVLAVLGVLITSGSSAFAACQGFSLPVQHGLNSYLVCDNSRGPVTGFGYQVSSPTAVTSGTEQVAWDYLAPGQVQINFDWGNIGAVGCAQSATGNNRILLAVQANDGTGVLLSLSGADAGIGYLVEAAHTFDPTSETLSFPLLCGNQNGRPTVVGVTPTEVIIKVLPPHIYSDCDPDSVGVQGFLSGLIGSNPCVDSFTGAAAIGGIYTSVQPCGTKPDVRKAAWTATGVTADPLGNATIPYTKPTADTSCLFVGTTTNVGGLESGSINGFIQVQGGLAAPPTAENVRAAMDRGNVKLSWSTSNEVGLAGFRLIAVSKTKGQFEIGSLVAANGTRSYTAEVRMGDLRGSRSIIIRSVLTDGSTVDAAPVNF